MEIAPISVSTNMSLLGISEAIHLSKNTVQTSTRFGLKLESEHQYNTDMQIFTLFGSYDYYEGDILLGTFSTFEKAQQAQQVFSNHEEFSFDNYYIDESVLDKTKCDTYITQQ